MLVEVQSQKERKVSSIRQASSAKLEYSNVAAPWREEKSGTMVRTVAHIVACSLITVALLFFHSGKSGTIYCDFVTIFGHFVVLASCAALTLQIL